MKDGRGGRRSGGDLSTIGERSSDNAGTAPGAYIEPRDMLSEVSILWIGGSVTAGADDPATDGFAIRRDLPWLRLT